MDIEPTQAVPLSDYEDGDETDEEDLDSEKLPVAKFELRLHNSKVNEIASSIVRYVQCLGTVHLQVAHLKVLVQKGFPETLYPIYAGNKLSSN